ncbi:hypothetical protein FOL47_009530 [Perkinsus chesapeaki]|uniref:Proteasome activator PA28 C-terminal domain-containing protein n=1 Tax=Perkinsus chesapeaki TaxID=330153 RepID=A0A7J6MSS5_PERCH|nr:hypothetical protein FOL47_009530 [Perkinsus chesapeaki]
MVNNKQSSSTTASTGGRELNSAASAMLNGTDMVTAKRELEQLLKNYDDDGEHLLQDLPLYILEVEKKIPTIFTVTGDVIEVEESFAAQECSASGVRSGSPNMRVVEAGKAVTKEIDLAIDRGISLGAARQARLLSVTQLDDPHLVRLVRLDLFGLAPIYPEVVLCTVGTDWTELSRLQRFVLMHIPKEEDGNNFGVAVQGQFYSKLSKYLKWCDAVQDEGKSYHHSRADSLVKLVFNKRMELDEKLEYRETVCEKEDKVTKSKATKTVANVPHMGDLTCYLARHDALQYFTLKNIMQGLISMYVHCYVYVKNNYEKIRWPRGRSEGLNMHMY